MKPEHEGHLRRILELSASAIDAKYRKGQAEHGGGLYEVPVADLINFAIDEAVDQLVYLLTIRDAMNVEAGIAAADADTARLQREMNADATEMAMPSLTAGDIIEINGETFKATVIVENGAAALKLVRYYGPGGDTRTLGGTDPLPFGLNCHCVKAVRGRSLPKDYRILRDTKDAYAADRFCPDCAGTGVNK